MIEILKRIRYLEDKVLREKTIFLPAGTRAKNGQFKTIEVVPVRDLKKLLMETKNLISKENDNQTKN